MLWRIKTGRQLLRLAKQLMLQEKLPSR